MKEVWGPNRVDTRSLRVFITSLRKKLEVDPSRPTRIITEPGVGYRLLMDTFRLGQTGAGAARCRRRTGLSDAEPFFYARMSSDVQTAD